MKRNRAAARLLSYIPLTLLAVACGGSGDDDTSPTPQPITWYKDIQPVVDRTCMRCHYENGPANTDFSSYEKAAPYAELMAGYVEQGEMPPPAADPGCRDYVGSERRFISEEEKALIIAWAGSGATEGNPADAPEAVTYNNTMQNPDAEIRIAEPYKPEFNETGNVYTCFVLDVDHDGDFYINGMEGIFDQQQIVHHILIYMDPNGDTRSAFGTDPFKCGDDNWNDTIDQVANDYQLFAGWGAGGPAVELPEGYGLKMNGEQDLVIQVHYYRSFEGADDIADQSGIRLRTTNDVDKEAYQAFIGDNDFLIPAGAESYSYTDDLMNDFWRKGIDILGVFPHMHVLGTGYRNWIGHPDGTETCLVESDEYAFHNQETYMFPEPALFGWGDVLYSQCTWNNSPSNPNLIYNPPIDITYGEGTDDEMCLFLTYYTLN
jgi:hypothetical protein